VLLELVVENYAVVERVRVRFHAGLNLLTGETGSGKSIVVDALGLLFGGRASAEMIRAEAARARISAIFEAPRTGAFRELLEQAGVEAEDGELLLEREILPGGKSRAFAGSRPVTAAWLRDLAPHLGDIHGQHEQQQLFSADVQLAMLDEFAHADELLAKTAERYREWRERSRELEELAVSERESLRMADLWSFQRKEIEAAALASGEEAELENQRRVLKNVARLQESAGAAYAALYDAAESAAAQVRLALRKLEELRRIDESLGPAIEALQPAGIAVEEVADTLRDYLDRLEADPARLDQIEARLALIDRLKRKYGGGVDEILQFLDEVRARLDAVENAGARQGQLEADLARAAAAFEHAANELSAIRKTAAGELAAKAERELASLALAKTVFRIEVASAPWSESGVDRVLFLISPNPGEPPRPLDKVASGGELSRIALALKTSIAAPAAKSGAPRTLVFDEVDAGIGGGVAETVGRRLKQLAASNQVLCVTHLAQIAGFADHHYSVEKREVKGRTHAEVTELTGAARTREIGRMLSGQKVTEEALKHAEQLIRLGAKRV
jgi:DNA repair protein RecN (Recombination protein N)